MFLYLKKRILKYCLFVKKIIFSFLVVILFALNTRSNLAFSKDIEVEIESDYRDFCKKNLVVLKHELPQYKEILPKLCPAVRFILWLNQQGDLKVAKKIAIILSRGAGVGGIDQSRLANQDEEKVMIDCLHKIAKKDLEIKHFQLESIDDSTVLGVHQKYIANALNIIRDPFSLFSKNKDYDFIRDDFSFTAFTRSISTVQWRNFNEGQILFKAILSGSVKGDVSVFDCNIGYTEQYGAFYPRAPLIHPYTMEEKQERVNFGMLTSNIRVKLPMSKYRQSLPHPIQKKLEGVDDSEIDLMFITQDLPWKAKATLLYRPQYWLDPNAPSYQAKYWKDFKTLITFWKTETGLTIHDDVSTFEDGGFSTHSQGADNRIVSSGANCSIENYIKDKKEQSLAFLSLIEYKGRYALTLHWLLIDEEQEALEKITTDPDIKNFADLGERLTLSPNLSQLYHFAF